MALTRLLDLTGDFNAVTNPSVRIDISGWDWIVVQLVQPTGTVTFSATNDAGAIEGVTDGNATSSLNYLSVQGTDLTSGTSVTTSGASSLTRFGVIGKFFRLSASGAITAGKVLVYLFKIS